MYVSGSLKNKTVSFYKEKMICFDDQTFHTSDLSIDYTGYLSPTPWYTNELKFLEVKQKSYIVGGIERTKLLVDKKGFLILKKDVLEIINLINKTSENIKYALFECLYKLIYTSNNSYDLSLNLKRFKILIDDVNNLENLYQADLDIILNLFMKNLTYTKDDIFEEKTKKFKIDERKITEQELYKLVLLGEFVAPNRLPIVAPTLSCDNEFTKYVVPIYFGIKDDKTAAIFLKNCRTHDLDFELIEKNAKLCCVPDNLINMVRR